MEQVKTLTKVELDKLNRKDFVTHLLGTVYIDDYHDEILIYNLIRRKKKLLKQYRKQILPKGSSVKFADSWDMEDKVALKQHQTAYQLSKITKIIGVKRYYKLILNNAKKKCKNIYQLY